MKKKAESTFHRLEQQRKGVMSLYDSLAAEQRTFQPEPGAWNLLQVMQHLVTAEKQSLTYIKRKMERRQDLSPAGAGARMRHLLLRIALFLPLKFKAPKIADVSDTAPDYAEMKQEWQAVREEMAQMISSADEEMLGKALYRHPRAGMLNLVQALEFFYTHIAHHQKQMRRILDASRFPS
ncbi:MAG: DinB family protein [Balneolaceae bacterium]